MWQRDAIISYVKFCILAENSSGLKGRDSSLCVSRRLRALVCSFSTSVVKLEGNQPHCKSRSLSPSYQPVKGEGGREEGWRRRGEEGEEDKIHKSREEGGGVSITTIYRKSNRPLNKTVLTNKTRVWGHDVKEACRHLTAWNTSCSCIG